MSVGSSISTTIPIIWQNINLGLTDRFENITEIGNCKTTVQSFFKATENQFLCLNPPINSHPIQKHRQIITPALMKEFYHQQMRHIIVLHKKILQKFHLINLFTSLER